MGVEIERKYLVNKVRWEQSGKGRRRFYRQGYILSDPIKTVRVRLSDTEAFLTIKGQTIGAIRLEYEYSIPKEEAKELLDNFCSSIIAKYRYEVQYGDKLWEVDEFLEDNEGLMVAEIELVNEQETFPLPDWVEREVTDEPKYYNANLAVHPYKSWKD
ncbi:CYTH domain-containing protein [Flavisolibacter tropicus]|uniref:Adenylate cyclase n=1 Tax=Flavisolibacter tropicus TaxID=1492898 RepID=A0A172TUH9_9BACT|nr:CYTH domain-containing protein [Flavisolibacter tropicus]ANE50745.1 adenylate cyclase [Flavisolibacter tropicus]